MEEERWVEGDMDISLLFIYLFFSPTSLLPSLSQNNAHLVKISQIIVRFLGGGTRLIEGEAGKRAAALLHQLGSSGAVPGEVVASAAAQLTPKQQASFQTFMQGKVPDEADD